MRSNNRTKLKTKLNPSLPISFASLTVITSPTKHSPTLLNPMTNSPPHVASSTSPPKKTTNIKAIPIEIVSEEEMALLEAALSATRSVLSSSTLPSTSSPPRPSHLIVHSRSICSITAVSKRRVVGDIEDFGVAQTRISKGNNKNFYSRFRRRNGLFVTDLTSAEWCEKQTEFSLRFGRITNEAMKVGIARHVKLEEEVVKKVKVSIESPEDVWSLKFINTIIGVSQLLSEGLTRELPVIGCVEGVWVTGMVDEIRMQGESDNIPMLVDTKTRVRDTLPSEPQRRNGRLQLMCYKLLWDKAVADEFPSKWFFNFFSLNPYYILSQEIRQNATKSGIPAKTLDDVITHYRNACRILNPAADQLLLRYESQKDNSLIDVDQFAYDHKWLKSQIQERLEFWLGQREASYVPEGEYWKCGFCKFALVCSKNDVSDASCSEKVDIPSSSQH